MDTHPCLLTSCVTWESYLVFSKFHFLDWNFKNIHHLIWEADVKMQWALYEKND